MFETFHPHRRVANPSLLHLIGINRDYNKHPLEIRYSCLGMFRPWPTKLQHPLIFGSFCLLIAFNAKEIIHVFGWCLAMSFIIKLMVIFPSKCRGKWWQLVGGVEHWPDANQVCFHGIHLRWVVPMPMESYSILEMWKHGWMKGWRW